MNPLSRKAKVSITIAASIFIIFAALCLYRLYNAVGINWQIKDTLDAVKNLATIIAIVVGAIWTYFNFFKGRTYKSRFESKVSGKVISTDNTNYLIVTIQLKNVGLSNVPIEQAGTALKVFAYSNLSNHSRAMRVNQTRIGTFSILQKHSWIEPSELIEDQLFIALPTNQYPAIELQLRIVSKKIEWNSTSIVELATTKEAADSSSVTELREIFQIQFAKGYPVYSVAVNTNMPESNIQ